MTGQSTTSPGTARFERTYDAPVELIWELWTTAAGLKEWFAPDGFETRVSELDLRPGGQLLYTMTATAPETVSFMRETGNPLSAQVRKRFTEVEPLARLAYQSVIDFVPDREPYEHLTTIDIKAAGDRTTVVMTLEPLHDETWTQQHRAHRGSELEHLQAAIRRRTDYRADLTINAPLESVFAAVSTVEGLSGWWTTDTSGSSEPGGELRFTFRDGIAVMRVENRTPASPAVDVPGPQRTARMGAHDGDLPADRSRPAATRLQFTHGGLRPQLDCYGHCSAGWNHLMRSLASYAETGTGHPVSP